MRIETGNLDSLNEKSPERGGWFLGKFMPEESLLHSETCEARWLRYPKGLTKSSNLNLEIESRTAGILISGKLKITFLNESREIILEKPGDFAAFDGLPHISEALEDTLLVVVRWFP